MLYGYKRLRFSCGTNDIYKDIAEDNETIFDTSNFKLDSLFSKGKNKKLFGLNDEVKKPKGLETCVINRRLNFENYKNCLEPAQIENKINHLEKQRFSSEKHNVFTEGINNTGLSSNDDKRMQPIDSTETYATE